MAPRSPGSAFVCDRAGTLVEVLRDSLGVVPGEALGRPVIGRIESGSARKWYQLLDSALGDRPEAVMEVELRAGRDVVAVKLAAAPAGDRVLVAAARSEQALTALLRDLVATRRDYGPALRDALRRLEEASRPPREPPSESFMAIYNEMVALQRELARKNAELEDLGRQKNELLGMVAHDLRTPLHGIVMAGAALEEGTNLTPRQVRLVRLILDSTQFLADLIGDVLDLTAVASGQVRLRLAPTDLRELVEKVVTLHQDLAARKGIAIRVEALESIRARVDPGKIEQVVSNLLSNAIKYSYSGSVVQLSAGRDGGRAVLAVADSGPGIPPERQVGLFQPFSTSGSRPTGGEKSTGLGLAIVKRIVEAHGGHVRLESAPGRGACFEVTLPLGD